MSKLFFCIGLFISQQCYAQLQPAIEWQGAYGGTNAEWQGDIQQTIDGGFITIGSTASRDGDVTFNHTDGFGWDVWIVKTDKTGNISWQKSYGGSGSEIGHSIHPTTDGGYIFCGSTQQSDDGDVSGSHNGNTGSVGSDAWVVKIDASGNIIWQKCFGGISYDDAAMIEQTSDGGYIFIGFTYSNDGDVVGFHDKYLAADIWTVKLDAFGNIQWQKCLGGDLEDVGHAIKQTMDGGYILCGSSQSSNGDVTHNNGSSDIWIVKLDELGNITWQKSYGNSKLDGARDIIQTEGGEYVFTGWTGDNSSGPLHPNEQFDIITTKLNMDGNLVWTKTYGGSKRDCGNHIIHDQNGKYVIVGNTRSDDGDINGRFRGDISTNDDDDIILVAYNSDGTMAWDMVLGGTSRESGHSIIQCDDKGYLVLGMVNSTDGDANGCGFHTGQKYYGDTWLIKLGSKFYPTTIAETDLQPKVYPTVTNGLVNVCIPGNSADADLFLVDLSSKNIPVTSVSGKNLKTINLENLPAGIYLLKIITSGQISVHKVIYQP